jgi:hypothetical protein
LHISSAVVHAPSLPATETPTQASFSHVSETVLQHPLRATQSCVTGAGLPASVGALRDTLASGVPASVGVLGMLGVVLLPVDASIFFDEVTLSSSQSVPLQVGAPAGAADEQAIVVATAKGSATERRRNDLAWAFMVTKL